MTADARPDDGNAPVPEAVSDSELIARVRAGDAAAYEELFLRHRDVAIRYARRFADDQGAEDLCAEAFAKILDLLQRGKGPDVAFRAYLLTTVRTGHLNNLRKGRREDLVPDHEPISKLAPVTEDPDDRFDRAAIFSAFSQLPERWQAALWLTTVEGLSNEEVGARLGIKPNAVASLAFRARSGLRQAYLAEHLLGASDPQCRRVLDLLPSHLRASLTPRRRAYVEEHLRTCARCTTAALELTEVETRLGAVLAPLALTGMAAAGVTVIPVASSLPGALVALKGGALAALGKVRGWGAAAPTATGAKVAVAASVAALGVAGGIDVLAHPGHPHPGAGAPTTAVTTPSGPRPGPATSGATHDPTATSTPPASGPLPDSPTTTEDVQVLPPGPGDQPNPAGPTDVPTSPGSPSATPTSTGSATPTATPARVIAVGPMSDATYTQSGVRREKLSVPVTGSTDGTTLVVTVNRTIQSRNAITSGTGWVCGVPTTHWVDGASWATAKYSCQYFGHSGSGPLVFDVEVAPGSIATASLTPPAGFDDSSAADNHASLGLRHS